MSFVTIIVFAYFLDPVANQLQRFCLSSLMATVVITYPLTNLPGVGACHHHAGYSL